MISGWGRSAGAVIPALGSGRYSPGPHIVLPSWRKGSALNFTTNVVWGQPGALATVSNRLRLDDRRHFPQSLLAQPGANLREGLPFGIRQPDTPFELVAQETIF